MNCKHCEGNPRMYVVSSRKDEILERTIRVYACDTCDIRVKTSEKPLDSYKKKHYAVPKLFQR